MRIIFLSNSSKRSVNRPSTFWVAAYRKLNCRQQAQVFLINKPKPSSGMHCTLYMYLQRIPLPSKSSVMGFISINVASLSINKSYRRSIHSPAWSAQPSLKPILLANSTASDFDRPESGIACTCNMNPLLLIITVSLTN